MTLPDGTIQPLTDFMRADRQQQVLLALRTEFAKLNVLRLPKMLEAVERPSTPTFRVARPATSPHCCR